MRIVDLGSGPPLVIVPGIQGRWEWMKPAVDALVRRCRVITFSLADEPTCDREFDTRAGFWCYVDQIRDAMDNAGLPEATICGVSYGGLIAAAFAARHPKRTSSLVLVSALPPTWTPDERVSFYLRAPRLLTPLFLIGALRMYREIAAATPGLLAGIVATIRHGWTAVTHMFSPVRMARRVTFLRDLSLREELGRVRVPTLIVTGEPELDRVVPVARTSEYLRLWPHAQHVVLAHTGHLGLITRPDEFARVVTSFVDTASEKKGDDQRRRVV
jgi:cis-3-alkyl-4-acyloxetan-2-one decarboxylase